MMTFVATYDLKWSHETPFAEFKKQAARLGWKNWVLRDDRVGYKLLNTVLVGDFTDEAAAERAFLAIAGATLAATGKAVLVEKWYISQSSVARFNSDEQEPIR